MTTLLISLMLPKQGSTLHFTNAKNGLCVSVVQGELLIRTSLMIPGYYKHQEVSISNRSTCHHCDIHHQSLFLRSTLCAKTLYLLSANADVDEALLSPEPFLRSTVCARFMNLLSALQAWEEMLKDGMMETGDIMEQRGPRNFVWIDRKKNIMKLSQVRIIKEPSCLLSGCAPCSLAVCAVGEACMHACMRKRIDTLVKRCYRLLSRQTCLLKVYVRRRDDVLMAMHAGDLQGEFVSVSRLEAVYSGSSPLIHQMYIYGSGLRSYLLAVVVPSPGETLCCSLHTYKIALHLNISSSGSRCTP